MNIALLHFRVGETDGVSLEMDKWALELEKLGHIVYYIAGNEHDERTYVINELGYDNQLDIELCDRAFIRLAPHTEESLQDAINKVAINIENKLTALFKQLDIELVIPNNLFSLSRSIPIAIGLYGTIKKMGIKAIGHHHDFYWERIKYAVPTSPSIYQALINYFPPSLSKMKHVVINSLAQKDLLRLKGLSSLVVPNVFDFNQEQWKKDCFNQSFIKQAGLSDKDVIFLQATRVVNRKAIELTIDLIQQMNQIKHLWYGKKLYDGRLFDETMSFVLLCVGLHEGTDDYENKLIRYAIEKDVKMVMNPNLVSHTRSEQNTHQSYALWDAYVYADIVSYPSIYEGFGNQLIEALFAKKPIVLFEYPVFSEDIKQHGFDYASLGNTYQIDEKGLVHVPRSNTDHAITTIQKYLFDSAERSRTIENNYNLGREYYGLQTLKLLIKNLIEQV